MSQPDFDPFDPISAAMGAMHGQNLLAAKDARIKQLQHKLKETEELLKETQENSASFEKFGWDNKDRIKQLEERLEAMREAGDAIWYCVRHAKTVSPEELIEAIVDWQEARNHG